MKIVVTGIQGFLGQYLSKILSIDHQIIGIARQEKENQKNLICDITDREKLLGIIRERIGYADVLIHAAAAINADVRRLYDTNCLGTQNIVDLATLLNCDRIINISSIPVIGNTTGITEDNPISESMQVHPATAYHLTKYLGEKIVEKVQQSGIRYINIRIPSPVGKGMPLNKIFSVFVKNALAGDTITIQGNGERVQNYLDLRDFGDAVKKCLIINNSDTFLVVGHSISDLALAQKCIKEFSSSSRININAGNEQESEKWFISGEKAKHVLGYCPRYTIQQSMQYVAEGLL